MEKILLHILHEIKLLCATQRTGRTLQAILVVSGWTYEVYNSCLYLNLSIQ